MTPEGRVKNKVNKLLKAHGDNIYAHMPVKSRFGAKTVDYLNCAYGWYFSIETKAPGKHPTPLQGEHIRRIEASGGTSFVIDGDTTELEQFLEYARRNPRPSFHQTQKAGSANVGANHEPVPGRPDDWALNCYTTRTY